MIEAYLQRVRSGLKGLSAEEAQDIIDELRSHLADQAVEWGEAAALAAMGDARELAGLYVAERMAVRVDHRSSPWFVLSTAYRLSALGLGAFLTFLFSAIGNALGVALLVMALAKPFVPDRIGLWVFEDPTGDSSFSIGRTQSPPGAEVLGWWLLPIGLLAGLAILFLTWRYSLARIRRLGRMRAKILSRKELRP